MKKIVDQKALNGEDNSVMYWLTGSQRFRMMKGVADSLAGRVAVLELSGLSEAEMDGRPAKMFHPDLPSLRERMEQMHPKNIHQIYQRIFRGSMPKLVTTDLERNRFYQDYVNTYLERDVRDLAQVGKLCEFYDFLVFMAARTSQELKYNEIANAIGISSPTAKAWVSILESSGIIFIMRPYYSNVTKRLVKTPKFYVCDTGLAAYLCRWPNAETLENGAMDVAIFETFVVSEIIKSYYNAGKQPGLYYYRDIDQKEIDLLMVEGDKLYPIEIKKGKAPLHPDKNFKALDKFKIDVQPGVIICMSDELIPLHRGAWYFPAAAL